MKATTNNNKKQPKSPDGSMSLSGHLKEMRNRLVVVLVILLVGAVACFALGPQIILILQSMGTQYDFQAIKPQESLMAQFSLSLLGAAVLAAPVAAYEIYAFMSPGLKKKERTFIILALIFGFIFFCVGVFFAYKVMLPFMLRFLNEVSENMHVKQTISIQEYISFVLLIFTIFGVVFEMPVISVLLTMMGIIRPEWMVKARKAVIVLMFVMAALITPPDIVSQIMVAFPMIFLYELSILLSRFFFKFKKEKAQEEEDEEEDV